MIFTYKALDERNSQTEGTIDSQSKEIAITSLQRRGWTILSLEESGKPSSFLGNNIDLFGGIKVKDVVWSKTKERAFNSTCAHCTVQDTCKWNVPSSNYYVQGVIQVRGERKEPLQGNLFGNSHAPF